ncbi:MAG: hypothetical protein OHK0039_09190 [Bacteroidia bacterium]
MGKIAVLVAVDEEGYDIFGLTACGVVGGQLAGAVADIGHLIVQQCDDTPGGGKYQGGDSGGAPGAKSKLRMGA